eukprot:TRINITY_DN3020_c0_g1_i7.p1 TRINITY_DN3020_c0_g1~~TRINITY_DN3020_c0_g1_i7.p1  ORF type:complete len:467 (+),score=120.11 TRINITY_DN3020_c0_g1_i7:130-1530(+)
MDSSKLRLDYAAFKVRPSEGTRFVIRKNKDSLFQMILDELSTWSLNLEIRLRLLIQLYNYILCCEDAIASHMKTIFRVLLKYVDDDSKEVQHVVLNIAYAVAFFLSPDVVFPYFLENLFVPEGGSEGMLRQSLKTRLQILNELVRGANKEKLAPHIRTLINVLASLELESSESANIVEQLLCLVELIMDSAKEQCKEYRSRLFSTILNVAASSGGVCQPAIDHNLEKLRTYCNLESSQQLYSLELPAQLKSLADESKGWNKTSTRRFAFKLLVLNAGEAIEDYWELVVAVLENCTQQAKDFELKCDVIMFLENVIDVYGETPKLEEFTEKMLVKVLIPCCVWKAGKYHSNVRRTSINCICKIVNKNLIARAVLYNHYQGLMSVLKSCLEDEWAADLRLASCALLKALIAFLSDHLTGIFLKHVDIDYSDIYPLLLSRLDDSQDAVRLEAFAALSAFLATSKVKIKE